MDTLNSWRPLSEFSSTIDEEQGEHFAALFLLLFFFFNVDAQTDRTVKEL